MKKLSQTLFLTAICFSSTVFASEKNYFYVGANAGIFQANFNNRYIDQTDAIAQNFAQSAEQHSYTGGAALGFRHVFNPCYFLGMELSGNYQGHQATFQSGASSSSFSDAVQIQGHADLTLVPGLMLGHTVAAYLKLGASVAALKNNLTSPSGVFAVSTNYTSNKAAVGFTAGLGLEKSITRQFAVFTEANYHDYAGVSFHSFQNFQAVYSHKTHVYSYDVVVGANYKFI